MQKRPNYSSAASEHPPWSLTKCNPFLCEGHITSEDSHQRGAGLADDAMDRLKRADRGKSFPRRRHCSHNTRHLCTALAVWLSCWHACADVLGIGRANETHSYIP